jgi:hypothetical protein
MHLITSARLKQKRLFACPAEGGREENKLLEEHFRISIAAGPDATDLSNTTARVVVKKHGK